MISESKMGWIVVNIGHPNTGNKFVVHETFATTKKGSIAKFAAGSGKDWKYWRQKYNFRCVKSISTIKAFNPKS